MKVDGTVVKSRRQCNGVENCIYQFIIVVRPDSNPRGVLTTSLEVYGDYDITTEPASTWNELIKDDWNCVQRWPNIILPIDRPQVVTVTVTTTATSQSPAQSSSGPSTSTGGVSVPASAPVPSVSSTPAAQPAPSSSLADPTTLAELVALQKRTVDILKGLGADTSAIDTASSSSQVPIPMDSRHCPTCKKDFSSHYRAVLHFKYKHLHKTKWQCDLCHKYFTSQMNLDEHTELVHGDFNFLCTYCNTGYELEKHLLSHLKVHKRFYEALKEGILCDFCHQPKKDMQGHLKVCKHNPDRDTARFICTNAGCTSEFGRKKDRNYHSKKKCPNRPNP